MCHQSSQQCADPSLRLGDLTLRKCRYQTGLPSLVNCLPGSPMTATINRDKASNHNKASYDEQLGCPACA